MLKKALFTGVAILLFSFLNFGQVVSADSSGQVQDNYSESSEIENVIIMIGDGLGMGQLEIARALEHGKEEQFHMEQMENVGLMQTYSDNYHVTDSAAAGTAIATSQKTDNGMIGMTPDGTSVQSILQAFQDEGKKTGVISTHSLTDATPAAFTAHVEHRDEYENIAKQQYENEYDVLLGGGRDYFLPDAQDGEDLTEAFQKDGYQYVEDREELMNVDPTHKLLGLFADENMALGTDRELIDEDQPSLSEMSDIALDVLAQGDDGFFLMVESARIDHAAHYGDATNVWKEVVEFDNTIKNVKDWANERDDTMVIVTADHETMGMSVTEVMEDEALQEISASPEYMVEQLDYDEDSERFTEESIQSVISEYAGFDLSEEDMDRLNTHLYEDDGSPKDEWDQAVELGLVIAENYNVNTFNREITENSESTSGHSANMVPIFASGPGSDHFNNVINNTDLSTIVAEQANIDFGEHVAKSENEDLSDSSTLSEPAFSHQIIWGDTLWGLSQNHNTTIEDLANDNRIENPDKIYAGDWLNIIPRW